MRYLLYQHDASLLRMSPLTEKTHYLITWEVNHALEIYFLIRYITLQKIFPFSF
jgi:hypothetical protein